MPAIDVFGLAVAVLIALVAQIVEPFSLPWWGGMLTAGAIASASGLHILWNRLSKSVQALVAHVIWRPNGYLRPWIGIALAVTMMGGGYVGSHGYGGFLSSFLSLLGPKKAPAPPAPPVRPPVPPKPWVTAEEIEAEKKLGRTLLIYSPDELIGMEGAGDDIDIYMNKWIKIDYPIAAPPFPYTVKNKIMMW